MAKKKQAAKVTPHRPRKGRAGQPPKGERVIPPEAIETIDFMKSTGHTFQQIADKFGVAVSTVYSAYEKHVRTKERTKPTRSLGALLSQIEALERIAWIQFRSRAASETREQIKEGILKGAEKSKKRGAPIGLGLAEKVTAKVTKTGQKAWLEVVMWAIEEKAKLLGHYSAAKLQVVHHEELRVAGHTADQVNADMMQRLTEKLAERKTYEATLRATGALQSSDN